MKSTDRAARPYTFVHGPKIRGTTPNTSLIRSQLMRRRHLERAKTVNSGSLHNQYTTPRIPICQCGQESDHRQLSPSTKPWEIGNSRIDPFLADRYRTTPHFDLLLHHCTHVLWPMARPSEFSERSLQAYLHPARSPMVVQSMLYSASLHFNALPMIRGATKRASLDTAEQLQLKGSVMIRIREKLSTVTQRNIGCKWVDDILLSILYLAANENLDHVEPPETSPFVPPFCSLQLMEFYGSCEFHPLHWQTVQHIVLERGGLETVKLYGLAWLISMSISLIVAINTHRRPVFPLISPEGKPCLHRAPLQALSIRTPPRHATRHNHGFQQLALLSPPVKGSLIRIFLDLNEITQALHVLSSRSCGATLLTQIGDTRASVLHRLCSLPDHRDRISAILHKRPGCTAEQQQRSIAVYLVCRGTALLHGASVVLPLPRMSRLRATMTNEIYENMVRLQGREMTKHECEIFLWCCVVAGICADATPSIRTWFVARVREYCNVLGIDSWDKLLELLKSFAWLDGASEEAGKTFWTEITTSGSEMPCEY
ncbi:hypothetical protein BO82DRAFT_417560 [Aspergillus uvarum CBS 121591]|uniref:Tachykinin family protein n=1 Tax=Aspergillus uvarum CBS 121591 TaxID=1448315 RepID=A0A319C982_9EURO|nr:hypothetical protein BO82DRAFT_417560 [Aspergillus uvarum CBS 121591]PYH80529.1 hypothetical protein BO82DRAFT_417560 [Aspergillus uvarum CBS 121591]